MKKSKKLTKEEIEVNAIIENLELSKIIMYIFKGQVLELDLKDFCMKYEIFRTEDALEHAIEKMINSKVIKRKAYPGTGNSVIVAKKPLNRFMCKVDDSIDFSINQVKTNSFVNSLILNNIEKPENCTAFKLLNIINYQSTFLHKRNDIEKGYKFFKENFTLQSIAESSFRCAMYRNTKGLKHIDNEEYSKEDDMEGYTNSFATFVNKNIYTLYKDDTCTFFILDMSDNLNATKIGNSIGFTIGTIYEQIDLETLLMDFKKVNFRIVTKDEVRREKILDSFRTEYNEEHKTASGKIFEIKGYKEHLLDAINRAANKRVNRINVKYQDKNKESKNTIELLNNFSDDCGLNLNIQVINSNLNDRLTIHNRTANIKTSRKIKHEAEMKAKYEKEFRDKYEKELKEKYERLYSAREEEIRQLILREYNLDGHPFVKDEEKYL